METRHAAGGAERSLPEARALRAPSRPGPARPAAPRARAAAYPGKRRHRPPPRPARRMGWALPPRASCRAGQRWMDGQGWAGMGFSRETPARPRRCGGRGPCAAAGCPACCVREGGREGKSGCTPSPRRGCVLPKASPWSEGFGFFIAQRRRVVC